MPGHVELTKAVAQPYARRQTHFRVRWCRRPDSLEIVDPVVAPLDRY
jgi:hypothetical protein